MDRGKYYQDKIMSYLSDDDDVIDVQINQFGRELTVSILYFGDNIELPEPEKYYYYNITYKGIQRAVYTTDFNGSWGLDDNGVSYNRQHYYRDEAPRYSFFAGLYVDEIEGGLLKVSDKTYFQFDIICEDIDIEVKQVKKDGTFFWENHPYAQSDFE